MTDLWCNVLDDGLIRLRRLWSPSRQRLFDDSGVAVEMSSLLVLEACARGAAAGREVSVADVASLADVAASTASRLVDRAVSAGLVERGTSRIDPRRSALSLTDHGASLQARAYTERTTWLAGQLRDWPAEDLDRLARLLSRFADTLYRGDDPTSPSTAPPGGTAVDTS